MRLRLGAKGVIDRFGFGNVRVVVCRSFVDRSAVVRQSFVSMSDGLNSATIQVSLINPEGVTLATRSLRRRLRRTF